MSYKKISMKPLLLILLWTCSLPGYAQHYDFKAPNYKVIEKEIKKEKSPLYYPALLEKFNQSDSLMTLEEERYLYYGYIFQEAYAPYEISDYADSLRSVLNKDKHTEEDHKQIIEFSDYLLAENPFNLSAISYKIYSYDALSMEEEMHKNIVKANIIIDVLLSSGDGMSKKTAFHVIYTSHEYDVLGILGFEFGGQQSLIEHYDYLKVTENDAGIEGLYFDVSPCLNHLSKTYK